MTEWIDPARIFFAEGGPATYLRKPGVRRLADRIREGLRTEPIEVEPLSESDKEEWAAGDPSVGDRLRGKDYVLRDGHHRAAAHMLLGRRVEAVVRRSA